MNKEEKICIIGGGISGLSAAYYLQKKGYMNVTVLEKSSRLGGKCHSIRYKDKVYEMGTLMGVPAYTNIKALMKEFYMENDGPLLYRGFFNDKGGKVLQIEKNDTSKFRSEFLRLPDIMKKYEFLQQPGFKNLPEELCEPFSKWCDKNELSVMKKVFSHCFTAYGFGYIDEIPAAYVLKFLDFNTLTSFIEITHLITWTEGIEELIGKLANSLEDIRLTSEVVRITRNETIEVETDHEILIFDKLVITSPLDEIVNFMEMDSSISELFGKISYEDFRVYAYKVEGFTPICGYIPQNMCAERKGHALVWYYRWNEGRNNELITVYSLGDSSMDEKIVKSIVEDDMINLGMKINGLYMHRRWKHFPHVDSETLKGGFYDKLEGLQGKNNTYYGGEIMNFSNIEKCTSYSKYLVETYF